MHRREGFRTKGVYLSLDKAVAVVKLTQAALFALGERGPQRGR
jgi:hypothetical protein